MDRETKEKIARNAASTWCRCFKCDGIIRGTHDECDKEKLLTCHQWYDGYRSALLALGDDRLAKDAIFSVHSEVVVTLTKHGAELLNQKNLKYREFLKDKPNVTLFGYRTDYEEGDTYHDMLWEIMATFGGSDKCFAGGDAPFTELKLWVPSETTDESEKQEEK